MLSVNESGLYSLIMTSRKLEVRTEREEREERGLTRPWKDGRHVLEELPAREDDNLLRTGT